jgi:hypothetical protein
MAALFECLNDVLAWAKDREGRYGWVNRAFLVNHALDSQRSGAAPELSDVIGQTDHDFSPAFLADQFRIDDEYVLAGHRMVDRIELVVQPDGQAVWNVTSKVSLVDDQGWSSAPPGSPAGWRRRVKPTPRGTDSARFSPTFAITPRRRSRTGNGDCR